MRVNPPYRSQVHEALIGLALFCALIFIASSTPTSAAATTRAAPDKDCSDFPNQAAAQAYFNKHHPRSDPDMLDGDGDGIACETSPCPCNYAGPGGGGGGHHHGASVKRDTARVESITDGDTIDVMLHGKTEPIRLIGIDTPEVFPVKECGGGQASKAMARALHPGDKVRLISDPSQDNRDRYHRLLRFVEHKGTDIGRGQIRKGWADVYVYDDNPFRRVKEYRASKVQARRHHRGVFASCHGHFHRAG